jgi:hypothetical protein
MTRSERVTQITELLDKGFTRMDIGSLLDLTYSTVTDYITDPTGEKKRTRRTRYSQPCPDCGKPMDGSNGFGPSAPTHCYECAPRHYDHSVWTRDIITDCIKDYADQYGHPPSAMDWNPAMARSNYRDDIAERFETDACWPYANCVQRLFGSWSAGIQAAGFEPLKPGHKYVDALPWNGSVSDPEIVKLYADGMTVADVARELGVHPVTVYRHLHTAGIVLRDDRRKKAA